MIGCIMSDCTMKQRIISESDLYQLLIFGLVEAFTIMIGHAASYVLVEYLILAAVLSWATWGLGDWVLDSKDEKEKHVRLRNVELTLGVCVAMVVVNIVMQEAKFGGVAFVAYFILFFYTFGIMLHSFSRDIEEAKED